VIFEPNLAYARDASNSGGHRGDKKRRLGMAPELLTDARETSYVI
jgi:hypothetical protein